nr:TPA_inf: conotoxin precursor H [Conus judaeus]
MRTSGRLLLLCLAVGLLLESQAQPNADAGDAIRDMGSDGTSKKLSKMLKKWQDSSADRGERKATARGDDPFYIFPDVQRDGQFH